MSLRDWLPCKNDPEPSFDFRLQRELQAIGGMVPDTRLPWARFCWGQDPEHRRHWAGRDMMAHTHHCDRVPGSAEPIYDIVTEADRRTGVIETKRLFKGYGRFYRQDEVIPHSGLTVAVVQRTDIGINRWFFEVADIHDEAEWESQRYRDTNGLAQFDQNNNLIDFTGPFPEGGVTYRTYCMLGRHWGQCNCKLKPDGVHAGACCCDFEEKGEICPGEYRAPGRSDIRGAQAIWHRFTTARTNSYGLREVAPDGLLNWATERAYKEMQEKELRLQAEMQDAIGQCLTPFDHMLTSHGHGPDNQKYHFLNLPTTPRDNQWTGRNKRQED